ncbi:7864_t:CDS:2, partial [Racocetra persica]
DNPSNRPTASDIHNRMYQIFNDSSAKNENELAKLKAFQSADAIIPMLSTELSNCPKDKLT